MTQVSALYRPDIDGLRAIAVLAVLLFHFDIQGFGGGFTGVDVFFVISGYLITSILLRDIACGNFTVASFWQRRVRRILPALLVVLVTCAFLAQFFLLFPLDYETFWKSLFAQGIFLGNLFFLRQHDYFSPGAELQPLLHTWSLSVEEQFYIFFPLLLLVLFKLQWAQRRLVIVLCLIILFSFSLNIYLTLIAPQFSFHIFGLPDMWGGARNLHAAFYLLPARAWELAVGALVAVVSVRLLEKRWSEGLSLAGLILIGLGFTDVAARYPFPGLVALLPVVGTALVIVANHGHQTLVGRLLSQAPVVWVGLLSYSLYLWHWPVYVFLKHYLQVDTLSAVQTLGVFFASLSLAYVTYVLVETPFRVAGKAWSTRNTLMVGVATIVLLVAGSYIMVRHGLQLRTIPETAQRFLNNTSVSPYFESPVCEQAGSNLTGACVVGEGADIDFVVWGDSHAINLLPLLHTRAKEADMAGIVFIEPSCLPLPIFTDNHSSQSCLEFRRDVLTYLREQSIPQVLVVARWELYKELTLPPGFSSHEVYFSKKIEELIQDLDETHMYLLAQPPAQPLYDARKIFVEQLRSPETYSDVTRLETTYEQYVQAHQFELQLFESMSQRYGVTVLYPSDELCTTVNCLLTQNNDLLYQDNNHLSPEGVKKIEPIFDDFFASHKLK